MEIPPLTFWWCFGTVLRLYLKLEMTVPGLYLKPPRTVPGLYLRTHFGSLSEPPDVLSATLSSGPPKALYRSA